MKAALPLLSFAVNAVAQTAVQSPPFRLFLSSANTTLDGTALAACHEGAAIEGLCLTNETTSEPATRSTTYYHSIPYAPTNTTLSPAPDYPNAEGYLVWNLTVNGNETVPSPLALGLNPTTNVLVPEFSPSSTSSSSPSSNFPLAFADDGCLYVSQYLDDTVSPPKPLQPPKQLKNWYVCLTEAGYLYNTLAWKVGTEDAVPQNPSCQKVGVKRVFV